MMRMASPWPTLNMHFKKVDQLRTYHAGSSASSRRADDDYVLLSTRASLDRGFGGSC